MVGLYDLFAINACLYPDKTALVDVNGIEYSYGKLSRRICALSSSLAQHGVGPGCRVGMMFRNGVDFVVSFYAILKCGGVVVPFPFRLFDAEVVTNNMTAQCSVFIVDRKLVEDFAGIRNACPGVETWIVKGECLPDDSGPALSFDRLIADGDELWTQCVVRNASDEELIMFTSGSTGAPKCVVHSHEGALMFFSLPMMSGSPFRSDDVMLYYAPLYHLAGVSYLTYLLSTGATLVVRDGFDAAECAVLCDRYGVTQLFIIPPTLIDDIRINRGSCRLDSVRWVILSGGASNIDIVRDLFRVFPNASVCNTYGQTERAANTILCFSREEFLRDPCLAASIGKATQYSEIKLLNERGEESNQGEAYARCPGMFKRYEGAPDPFVDGWFPTGDVLRRNDDGYYWFVDRSKGMIKSGGENVFSLEVERTLNRMPAVLESAVFGLPDKRFDEAVSAAIVLKEGADCTKEEVELWCRARMAGFKRPRNIFFVSELPRNSVGKIQKGVLRERFGAYEPEI